jgi:hypothetical protein
LDFAMAGVAEADVEARRHAQITRELDMREKIRGDVAGSFPQPFYSGYGQPGYPFHGAPVGLGELGFGEGKFASELSRLQYQAPAERGLSTACEESEKLLERYRRERHLFTPMESEIRARSNGKSATLEPIKSVSTKVAEEAELEKRLFMRSYNPYVEGVYPHPNYAMGYRVPEMALAADKAQRDEMATLARSRPLSVNADGSPMVRADGVVGPAGPTFGLDRIGEMDSRAQEDALRQMHVLSPTRQSLSEAYRYRY